LPAPFVWLRRENVLVNKTFATVSVTLRKLMKS